MKRRIKILPAVIMIVTVIAVGLCALSLILLRKAAPAGGTAASSQETPGVTVVRGEPDSRGRYTLSTCDRSGRTVAIAYYLSDGSPAYNENAVSSVGYRYDSEGRRTGEAYFDEYGTPCTDRGGVAALKYEYDGDELTGWSCLGPEGNPAESSQGWYSCSLSRREAGKYRVEYEMRLLGEDGEPCMGTGGESVLTVSCLKKDGEIRKVEWKDTAGNVLRGSFAIPLPLAELLPGLKEESAPETAGRDGDVFRTYDKYGCLASVTYLDDAGREKDNAAGISREEYVCDNRGNRLYEAYFNAAGEKVCKNGCAAVEKEYDIHNHPLKTAYYGTDGRPVDIDYLGYAVKLSRCDILGREIYVAFYDADGNCALRHGEYACATYEYDEWGNCVRYAYYNGEGRLTRPVQCFEFDEWGHCLSESFRDTEGRLVMYGNYALYTETWDIENNRALGTGYYDELGYPVYNPDRGYAYNEYTYDDERGICRVVYYDARGYALWRTVSEA